MSAFGLIRSAFDPKRTLVADEVEVVLANIDANRRHLICRFAGNGSCSFSYLHLKPKGASRSTVSPFPLADVLSSETDDPLAGKRFGR